MKCTIRISKKTPVSRSVITPRRQRARMDLRIEISTQLIITRSNRETRISRMKMAGWYQSSLNLP